MLESSQKYENLCLCVDCDYSNTMKVMVISIVVGALG